MKVLMITKFLPLPANTGGKKRSLAILNGYLAQGADVHLCAHDDGTGDVAALEALGVHVISVPWKPSLVGMLRNLPATKSLLMSRFWSRELMAGAVAVANEGPLDVLQVEYLQNVPYRRIPARVQVLDLHDVVSEQTARIGAVLSQPKRLVYAIESRVAARIERAALEQFQVVACVSEGDKAQLAGPQIIVAPNGWDPSPALTAAADEHVTFVGNFAFPTNADAAAWFVQEAWPKLRARCPQAQLWFVGKDPTEGVRALASVPGVTVTGTVDDMRPYLQQSCVTIAPLRAGGGSRLKILEALECGRPVVSTTLGMEGLDLLEGKGVVIADTPETLASAIAELLEDPPRAVRLGAEGRKAVHEHYLWENVLDPMFRAVQELLPPGHEE